MAAQVRKIFRFLLFSIEGDCIYDHSTLLPIWQRITWSLNSCFEGLWPSCGPAGEALRGRNAKNAGKFLCPHHEKFCVSEIRGDWSWLKETFRFPFCSWIAQKICYKCPAIQKSRHQQDLLYYRHGNVTDGPHWLQKEFSLVQFLRHRIPEEDPCLLARMFPRCCTNFQVLAVLVTIDLINQYFWTCSGPLLALHGFHPGLLKPCGMHTLNLGLCMHVNGSSLPLACFFLPFNSNLSILSLICLEAWSDYVDRSMLLSSGYFGAVEESLKIRLDAAYKHFRQWTRRNRIHCSQPPFTEKLVTSHEWELDLFSI